MKQSNLKGEFYSVAIRSAGTIVILILLLALVPQATMLQNQNFILNNTTFTGVDVAKVLISLVIVGILLNFAYVSETQLPKITPYKRIGLIIASVIHITVIFVAYSYLLPFATDRQGDVDQVFNALFLGFLCVPLYRGGTALYETIGVFTKIPTKIFEPTSDQSIKCAHCEAVNDSSAKFCRECGKPLPLPVLVSEDVVCNRCNTKNESSAKFCSNCGNNLVDALIAVPRPVVCPQCGVENKVGVKYCVKCGTEISENLQTKDTVR